MTSAPRLLKVTSNLFQDGQPIPKSAAYPPLGGQNISPDLHWGDLPDGTRSVAVTVYDPDAPTPVGFVHWVLFNLDPSIHDLETGAGASGKNPAGSVMGITDWGKSQYGGMAPPPGDPPHRYQFTVYALDVPRLESGPTTTYARFHFQVRGHILAQGTLTGLFGV